MYNLCNITCTRGSILNRDVQRTKDPEKWEIVDALNRHKAEDDSYVTL